MSGSTHPSGQAFVLGLDGVPWRLIEQWSDEGKLPNFARLREEGASGTLESTRPPTTPLAWPSIATGVWADKHGVYGFQNLSSEYSHEMYTSHDINQPTLWEQLSPAHVGNVPMTYPAHDPEDGGSMVTGMMTPSTDQQFAVPDDLQSEIKSQIPDYEISLDYPEYADRLDDFEVAVDDMLATRRELMQHQMDRAGDDWRLFFFVYTAPDRFQHLIWDMDRILAHYQKLDDILGEVLEYTDQHEADLYVVSDHGFGPINELVYINHILEREGYLVRREDEGTRGALASLGISRDRITDLLGKVGISEELLVSTLPRKLVDSVAEQIPGDHALYDVDYEQTTAFVHGAGNCYINDSDRFADGIVSPSDVPQSSRNWSTSSSRSPTRTANQCSESMTATSCSRPIQTRRISSSTVSTATTVGTRLRTSRSVRLGRTPQAIVTKGSSSVVGRRLNLGPRSAARASSTLRRHSCMESANRFPRTSMAGCCSTPSTHRRRRRRRKSSERRSTTPRPPIQSTRTSPTSRTG